MHVKDSEVDSVLKSPGLDDSRYRKLFENIESPLLVVAISEEDPQNLVLVDANPAFMKMFVESRGLDPKGGAPKFRNTILDCDRFGMPAHWPLMIRQVAITGKSTGFEDFADGLNRRFRVHFYSPEEGQAACLFEDITETEATREATERSRDFYLSILNDAPALIRKSGVDGNCDWFNKKWLDFRGTEIRDEIDGGWSLGLHSDDRERCRGIYLDSFRSRLPYEMIYRLLRRDGQFRWIHDMGRPIVDIYGEFAGYIGYCFDITDRKNAEEAIVTRRKIEAIGLLAGGIAHDFNNLLQVISGHIDFMRLSDPDRETAAEELSSMALAADRAGILVNRILAFGMRQTLQMEPVDLDRLIETTLKLTSRMMDFKIKVDFLPGPGIKTVMADPIQMERVFVDLALNSRDAIEAGRAESDASPQSCGEIRVETRLAPLAEPGSGNGVEIIFSDDGPGVPSEIAPHVFEPFFTTKSTQAGSGMGLASVYGILAQHGGSVELLNDRTKGAAFRLLIPAQAQGEEAGSRVDESREGPGSPIGAPGPERAVESGFFPRESSRPSGERLSILVAEDEEMVRDLLERILSRQKMKVRICENGSLATALFEASPHDYDAAIFDVMMPEMDGMEAAERIRAIRPDFPVLFISGYDYEKISGLGDGPGRNAFVKKPFLMKTLIEELRKIVEP